MMQGISAPFNVISLDRRIYSRKSSSHLVIAGAAFAVSVSAGFWALSQRANPGDQIAAAPAAQKSRITQNSRAAPNPYGAIVGLGGRPQSLAMADATMRGGLDASVQPAAHTPSAAVPEAAGAAEQVASAEDAPLPPRRPAELSVASRGLYEGSLRRMARTTVVPASPPDDRSMFEKFFGLGDAAQEARKEQQQRPRGQALAYASTDTSVLSDLKSGILGGAGGAAGVAVGPATRYDRYTAVYDISAHTVYLPDGRKLEAHSGLREHIDDPRYVHLRMRGATPPHVYDLSPREALFHGVEALRLTPVGGQGAIFGRAGLLAHTYMLGPRGDSNGCVSFRDYQAFLRAY
ncbi:MAG: DUF2778 domain-containing protein, partial [Methylocystis sp.]